jgi:hypothetical protein
MKRKAVALIITCVMTMCLCILGIGFVMRSMMEQKSAGRYGESVRSFWAAEAGATLAYYNLRNNASWDPASLSSSELDIGDGEFAINVITPTGEPYTREVTVTGTIDNQNSRTIFFTIDYPPTLNNVASVGDTLRGTGIIFALNLTGDTEVGNKVEKATWSGYVEDDSWVITNAPYSYDWGTDPDPKIIYPDGDTDVNSTTDEFSDFKDYNQDTLGDYSSSEVVYIQTDSTVTIWPGWDGEGKVLVGGVILNDGDGNPIILSDKKVLYVEGTNAGDGDVDIYFGAAEVFGSDSDFTVVSTGTVTYIEPLQSGSSDGRLNVIAWDDYNEAGILFTNHNLNVYSHDDVNFLSVISLSNTEGVYIANDDLDLVAILAMKSLNFPANVTVPPGFEGFGNISQGNIFAAGTVGELNKDWQEL